MNIKEIFFEDGGWYSERIYEYRGYYVLERYDEDDEKFFHHSCEVFLHNKCIVRYIYSEADRTNTHIDNIINGTEVITSDFDTDYELPKNLQFLITAKEKGICYLKEEEVLVRDKYKNPLGYCRTDVDHYAGPDKLEIEYDEPTGEYYLTANEEVFYKSDYKKTWFIDEED